MRKCSAINAAGSKAEKHLLRDSEREEFRKKAKKRKRTKQEEKRIGEEIPLYRYKKVIDRIFIVLEKSS